MKPKKPKQRTIEFTRARPCPGPLYGEHTGDGRLKFIEPHGSRWWRFVDLERRDGWHCCGCGAIFPEVSPIDGTEVARPADGLARTVTDTTRLLAA